MDLSAVEREAIRGLQRSGMNFERAAIATIMVNRNISTVLSQLVDEVIRGYPGLENATQASDGVQALVDQGWLETSEIAGVQYCRSSANLITMIEDRIGSELTAALVAMRTSQSLNLTVYGAIYDQATVDAIHESIRGAQRDIRLPLLATPTNIEIAHDLQARAEQGVRVHLLVAAPSVVVELRGSSQESRGIQSVEGWTATASRWPNTEVRIATSAQDMLMAASASFDEDRMLLAVFDPRRQRSHQGTVVAVGQGGFVPNVVTLFNRTFDDAWARARRTDPAGRLLWLASRFGWETGLILSLVASFALYTSSPVVANLAVGIAATIVITLALKYREPTRALVQRVRRKAG